jgi:threonine aldolase
MRQAGFMAAAGIYALQNNITRLATDHLHAQQIASALQQKNFVGAMLPVETNIIIFEVLQPYTAKALAEKFGQHNIRCIAISPTQIRIVTHLDITAPMANEVISFIQQL